MSSGTPNADELWVSANREVVERAFDVFVETSEWPKVADLRRHFARLRRDLDVAQAVKDKPRVPGEMRPVYEEALILKIRHLRYVPRAQPLVQVCLAATRRAVEAYLSDETQPKVTSTDQQIAVMAGGDERLLIRAGALLQAEPAGPLSGGGFGPDHWDYWINDATVMTYEGAATPAAFVERQERLLQKDAEQLSQYMASPARSADVQSRRVFVLMPFAPAWSRAAYEMIKRAVGTVPLPSPAVVRRADDITDPGRITDQIVTEVTAADVIVADITGLNPNVMWELGYAHALGKPVVILNQNIDASPFDLLDHRQVGYADHPTADDEGRVTEFLRSAFGV